MDELFRDGKQSSYSRGEPINTKDVIILIESGVVGLYSIDEEYRRFIFGYIAGDIFPYASASNIFKDRVYTYIAMQKTTVRVISKARFKADSIKPRFVKPVMDNLIEINKLQLERLDNLQHSKVINRLLERLCFYAVRFGKAKGDKCIIEIPISHVDFASSIGTSRETVNRYMKQLENLGIVSVRRQRITINSFEKLKDITYSKQLPNRTSKSLLLVATITAGFMTLLVPFFGS